MGESESRRRGWAEETDGPCVTSESIAIMAAAARRIRLELPTRLMATGQPEKRHKDWSKKCITVLCRVIPNSIFCWKCYNKMCSEILFWWLENALSKCSTVSLCGFFILPCSLFKVSITWKMEFALFMIYLCTWLLFLTHALINFNQMIPQHNHTRAMQLANNDPFSSQWTESDQIFLITHSKSSFTWIYIIIGKKRWS